MKDYELLQEFVKRHMSWPKKLSRSDDELRLYFMCLAAAGEAGELANLAKKEWRDGSDPERLEKMRGEVVDVANYLFMIAALLGVDLIPEMVTKLIEVENRPEWKQSHG